MKLEISFRPDSTEFGINMVEDDGNGIIVCQGNLAGSTGRLPEVEELLRVKALEGMVALWNDYYGD
jgi:hypothetical protein